MGENVIFFRSNNKAVFGQYLPKFKSLDVDSLQNVPARKVAVSGGWN